MQRKFSFLEGLLISVGEVCADSRTTPLAEGAADFATWLCGTAASQAATTPAAIAMACFRRAAKLALTAAMRSSRTAMRRLWIRFAAAASASTHTHRRHSLPLLRIRRRCHLLCQCYTGLSRSSAAAVPMQGNFNIKLPWPREFYH